MRIGYARVSTTKQDLERQLRDLQANNCEKIFTDKATGSTLDRQGFKEMMRYAREHDTIVFQSLDRLGRNYDEIKQVITHLQQNDIGLEILDAPFLKFNTGNETLDKAMFDMMISLLGYIAENERKKLLERQAQGIKIAKERGKYKGRPASYSADSKDVQKRNVYFNILNTLKSQTDKSIKDIAIENGVSRTVVYKIQSELNQTKKG
ncbi:recombinase family protein [Globicatella sanguinis]